MSEMNSLKRPLQILVISLEQSLSRREQAASELAKTTLDWRFLDAVDGRKLSYPIPEYPANKVKRLLGFELTPNEIGCFLSHRAAWQQCIATQIPTLVFEDDFLLLPHFEHCVEQLLNHPKDWQIVRLQALLETPSDKLKSFDQFDLVQNHADPLGATAYLIQPAAAKILVAFSEQIYEPLDHFLEHHAKHGQLTLAAKPYPVDITKVVSTIADRPNDRKPIKGFAKNIRSFYRWFDRTFSKDPWFPK
jgi:glycosyl transferase family 25